MRAVMLALHTAAGTAAVTIGALALAPSERLGWHPRILIPHQTAVAAVCTTAIVL